jgi:hypothetical protein
MEYLLSLKLLVLASAAVCLAGLAWQVVRTLRFGRRGDPSVPSGSATAGVLYAFGPGMAPWAKESARAHLLTWIAGVLYHLAVFAAAILLAIVVAGLYPNPDVIVVWRIILAVGLAAGLGLFFKRLLSAALAPISCPDDFASNLMVDGFLALALAATWEAAVPSFLIWSAALLLYIPVGKIRHCFFFFYTRLLFGRFFGRRGVLPGTKA